MGCATRLQCSQSRSNLLADRPHCLPRELPRDLHATKAELFHSPLLRRVRAASRVTASWRGCFLGSQTHLRAEARCDRPAQLPTSNPAGTSVDGTVPYPARTSQPVQLHAAKEIASAPLASFVPKRAARLCSVALVRTEIDPTC